MLYEMESELLINIARLLGKGANASAEWQALKLSQLGTLRAMNEETIKAGVDKAVKAARAEIEAAGAAEANRILNAVPSSLAAALPDSADLRLIALWNIWETRTMNQFRVLGMTLITKAQQMYVDAVYAATAKTLAGQITLRQAIAETAMSWKGIPAITDAANRTWTVEAYAQTVIRSNIRQVATETTLAQMENLNLDLVEVSAHIGARPGCAPYQGRVYSLRGDTPGYPRLSDTSYGEPDGLFGINCGHQMYPYSEGERQTFKPYPKAANENAYEESQKQRYLERQIRDAKRKIDIAKATGSDTAQNKAQSLLSARQQRMRDFIDDTDRTRRYDREKVY